MRSRGQRLRFAVGLAGSMVLIGLPALLAAPQETRHELRESLGFEVPAGLEVFALRIPNDTPMTRERIELGKRLFFDRLLSRDGTVACADCHNPKLAFTDGKPVAAGISGQKGKRSSPTLVNRAFSTVQFWDGRAVSLEEQAKGPMVDSREMGNRSHEEVVARLSANEGYLKLFEQAFGVSEPTVDHVARAIATFERTLLSGNSPFDRFLQGDRGALSAAAERGMELFRGKAGCSTCHAGFNFTDERFHTLGTGYRSSDADFGRYHVTGQERDKRRFKTPTLREIALTTPYMHDGRFSNLEDVVDFYDRGGIENARCAPNVPGLAGINLPVRFPTSLGRVLQDIVTNLPTNSASEIKPLSLSKREKRDLVEFLKSLSGEGWQHAEGPFLVRQ